MSEDAGYEPVLIFDDESPSFVHGFEAGQLWQGMKAREPLDTPIHEANLGLVRKMLSHHKYTEVIEPCAEGDWYRLRAMPKEYQL